jgi:hypothetical protein
MNRSNFRTAVIDANALVDKGDLAAARTRLKDLDKLWDGAMASSTPQTRRTLAGDRQGDQPQSRSPRSHRSGAAQPLPLLSWYDTNV